MSFFTWKDNGLTSDCSSLDAMASRFEETANLMKKLSKKGFKLKKTKDNQLIIHSDPEVFNQWGFISEELPFKQLCLIQMTNLCLRLDFHVPVLISNF